MISFSQEMLGTVHSNYAGIYGIGTNPSSMVASKLYMDFNLFSAQSFLDNNYVYISKKDFLGIIQDRKAPQYFTEENESRAYAIYRERDFYSGFQNLRLTGPGAMLVDGIHAFGITTSYREITSFNNMPNDVAIFLYEAIDFQKQHNIDYTHDIPIRVGSLSWFEINLSYAINFYRKKWSYWSAGITLKPLLGTTGAYAAINNVSYNVLNDTTAIVNNASFNFGISLPINYANNSIEPKPFIRGFGFGVDFGIIYQYTTKGHSSVFFNRICEQPYDDYNYRIGLSIVDLGYIKFKKKAIYQNYSNVSTYWYKPDDNLPDSTINNLVDKVDFYFNGREGEVVKDDNFVMYLPPVLGFQADINLRHHFYFNVSAYIAMQISERSVYRPSLISLAPRYETAKWEVSLPVSIYAYIFKSPRIGFAFRYGNFFGGADRLNTITGLSDFTGMDVYAGIRLNLSDIMKFNFIKGNCGFRKARNIETFDFRNF